MPKIFHSFVSVMCWWNKSCSEYLFVYWSLLILCNLLCIYKCIVSHLSFFSKFLIHSVKWFAKKILRRYLFFCPGQVCCHCLIFVRDHAWWVGFVKENKIIHGFFLFASCFSPQSVSVESSSGALWGVVGAIDGKHEVHFIHFAFSEFVFATHSSQKYVSMVLEVCLPSEYFAVTGCTSLRIELFLESNEDLQAKNNSYCEINRFLIVIVPQLFTWGCLQIC